MLIKNFKEISKSDAQIAGGKGAALGEMTNAGIPVPPGFVVLSEAFEQFLVGTDLNVEIEAILKTVNNQKMHTVENASEEIQALIFQAKMPENIKKEITRNFKKLDTKLVAVRSSATAEDGAEAAWAGQLNSYLNTNQESLLKNVQKCWASLFTPRAIFYRFEKKLHKQKISVAVVIQKMIQSEISGIAFSVHPMTEDYSRMIIEAGFGLGEAIVSGSITPDAYVVSKEPRKIEDINIVEQTKGLFKKADDGNAWQDISKQEGKKQKLSKKQILELSDLIVKIEDHYQFPVDIEWAYENKKFYIVQSRPITTLSQKKQEYRKIMTRPQNLINSECWDIGDRLMFPKKFKNFISFDPLLIYTLKKAVSIYYNFTDPKQNLQPLLNFLNDNLNWLKKEKLVFDANCENIRKIIKDGSRDHAKLFYLIKEIWPMIVMANIFGSTDYFKVKKALRSVCVVIRNESDDVLHPAINYLTKIVLDNISKKKYIDQILYSEFVSSNIPSDRELRKRVNGWVLHKGKIINKTNEYFQENNIQIVSPTRNFDSSIIGNVAAKGFAQGRVRIVFELIDLKNIKRGDVLVTPMTTPEMISTLKKVSAVVTDEGGITCHAAIISRELNIPCVIGTINATQILKNGDLVEIDANKGIVKILKKAKIKATKRNNYKKL